MKIENITLKDFWPTLNFDFKIIKNTDENNRNNNTLLIIFEGEYREGSTGNIDADIMSGVINLVKDIFYPLRAKHFIVDLSFLKYTWGNRILKVFQTPVTKIIKPTAFIIGPDCSKAINNLIYGSKSVKKITDTKFFYTNLEEAYRFVTSEEAKQVHITSVLPFTVY